MSGRSNRAKLRLGRQEVHSHPLDTAAICCPDHVFELCSLLQPQGRSEEIVTSLLALEGLLDTRFLLDASEQTQDRKRALLTFTNEYALWSAALKDVDTAFSLLSVAETLLGSFQGEESGLRATLLVNLAYVSVLSHSLDQGLTYLDEADRLSKAAKDVIGCASVKITKSALHLRLKSYQEAYIQAQHAVKLMEDFGATAQDADLRKARILLAAAKLNMAAASEYVAGGRAVLPTAQLRSDLVRVVESKGEMEGKPQIREYDESPIYKEEAKAAVSNMEDDLGSFLDGVQRWDKVKSIDNPSFVVSPESNKHSQQAKFPAPVNKLPRRAPPDPEPPKAAKDKPSAVPPLPLSSKPTKAAKALIVPVLPRLPNSALPVIPQRPLLYRNKSVTTSLRPVPRPDYALALDELVTNSEETVRTIKTMEGTAYFLQCSLQRPSLLKLSAMALSDKDEAIPSEAIDLEQLKSIVNMLGIAEVLPTDFPSKFVLSYSETAHFFILPFFQVTASEETGKKKVELWSISQGILESQVVRVFLDHQRRLVLHQTSPTSLRICLTDLNSEPSADTLVSLDVVFSEQYRSENIQLHEGKQTWLAFKPISLRFLDKLEAAIDDLEKELKRANGLPIVLTRLHILDEPSSKPLLYYVYDNEPMRKWEITVKQLTRNTPALHSAYSYAQLVSSFGVLMRNLDTEDRRWIASQALDLLKVHFAPDTEEDSEAMILAGQVEVVASYRTFLKKEKTMIPVTLSLVGVKERLVGIRATAFNARNCLEAGCFLSLNTSNYAIVTVEAGASKKKKYNKLEGLAQIAEKGTALMALLREKGGWETVLAALRLENSSLCFLDKNERKRWFGRLESLVLPLGGKVA